MSEVILNPNTFSWNAPTEREDGSPISIALDYEIGVKYPGETTITPLMVVVGELQEGGNYVAQIDKADLPRDTVIELFMRAIDRQSEGEADDLYSRWTDESILIKFVAVPNPPTNFTVA